MRIPTLLVIVFAPGVIVLTGIEVWGQSLERTVYATVVTQAGVPVDDLLAADFVVKENGSALNVRTVSRAVDPIDIAVLVNLGDGDIGDVQRGLVDLFDAIDAPHDMALTSISRPAVKVDFTRDPDTLVRGITALSLRGAGGVNASMRDAVLDSARALQKRPPSRRVIIIVSDGSYRPGDKRADLQAALRGSGTTLYEVAVADSQPPYAYELGNGDYYIKPPMNVPDAVPKASGGRVFHVLVSTVVPAAFAEIASDINHQYRIDYTRPAAAAAPDLVDVGVQQSGLTVRATRFAPR